MPLTSKYPHVRRRRIPTLDGEPIPDAPVGTLLHGNDGEAVLFIGDTWPTDSIDITAVAAHVRHAPLVTVIGDTTTAGRPCLHALRDAWAAADKATKPPQPVDLTKPPTPRCRRPRRDSEPCKQYAGLGTDHLGTGPCRDHGGDTTKRDAAAATLRQAIRTNSLLAAKSRFQKLTLREQLDQVVAVREIVLAAETKRWRNRPRRARRV